MTRAKVYIVCEPYRVVAGERINTVDLTPASAWGEPVILLQSSQCPMNVKPLIDTLREKLRDFGDDDYLIPIGDPILMCIASAVAAEVNRGFVKLLKWDRIQSAYIPIQMNV